MSRFPANPERRPAVVTGASSGIGQATALVLAAAGHPVVLGARRVDEMATTADQIRAAGGEAHVIPLDLGDPASPAAFAAEAADLLGEIEIVVSNAAMNQSGSMLTTEPEDFARTLTVNVEGNHRLLQALLPAMQAAKPRPTLTFTYANFPETPRPYYRLVLVFNYANDLRADAVCEGTRRTGPTTPGVFKVFAIYCRNELAMSQTTAWTPANGPDDPRIQQLFRELFMVVFSDSMALRPQNGLERR